LRLADHHPQLIPPHDGHPILPRTGGQQRFIVLEASGELIAVTSPVGFFAGETIMRGLQLGTRRWMTSALYKPLTASARALS